MQVYRILVFAFILAVSLCAALPGAHAQIEYGASAAAEVDISGSPEDLDLDENFGGRSASAHAELVGVVADSSVDMHTASCLVEITDVADCEAFTPNTFFWDTFTATSSSTGMPTTVTFLVQLDAALTASSDDPAVAELDVQSGMIVGIYRVNLTDGAPGDDDVVEELFVGSATLDAVGGLTETDDLADSGFTVSEVSEGTGYSGTLSDFTIQIDIDTTVGSPFSLKFSLETWSGLGLSDGTAIADLLNSLRIVEVQTEDGVDLVRASGATDTDGDGLADYVETDTGVYVDETDTGTDPNDPDTDNDDLDDGGEVNTYLTDPLDDDSDDDGYADGTEVAWDSDPNDPDSVPTPSGGGGTCFIATAAYGTALAEEVRILCEFRDEYLMRNRAGRAFVGAYYRLSPPVAQLIARHKPVRKMVRIALIPLVTVARFALRWPLVSTLALSIAFTVAGFSVWRAAREVNLRQRNRPRHLCS